MATKKNSDPNMLDKAIEGLNLDKTSGQFRAVGQVAGFVPGIGQVAGTGIQAALEGLASDYATDEEIDAMLKAHPEMRKWVARQLKDVPPDMVDATNFREALALANPQKEFNLRNANNVSIEQNMTDAGIAGGGALAGGWLASALIPIPVIGWLAGLVVGGVAASKASAAYRGEVKSPTNIPGLCSAVMGFNKACGDSDNVAYQTSLALNCSQETQDLLEQQLSGLTLEQALQEHYSMLAKMRAQGKKGSPNSTLAHVMRDAANNQLICEDQGVPVPENGELLADYYRRNGVNAMEMILGDPAQALKEKRKANLAENPAVQHAGRALNGYGEKAAELSGALPGKKASETDYSLGV